MFWKENKSLSCLQVSIGWSEENTHQGFKRLASNIKKSTQDGVIKLKFVITSKPALNVEKFISINFFFSRNTSLVPWAELRALVWYHCKISIFTPGVQLENG